MKRLAPALAAALLGAAGSAAAQQFGVYLNCSGQVASAGRTLPARVDLALRRNSALALVTSSDILPGGQKMKLDITPQHYTMVFDAPPRGSVVFHDWLRGALLVWNPDLHKVHTIRLAVDRRSAALAGELRDGAGSLVGRIAMQCQAKDNDSVEAPKF